MRDAFQRIDAKQTASAAASTVPATTPQAAPAQVQPPTAGPIPFDVHHRALENARTTAVSEYRQRFGWAEQVPQQQFQQVATFLSTLQTNPIGFVQQLIADIQRDPQWGPQWAASQPAPRAAAPSASLDPDVEIIGPDGRPAGATYSAERVKAIVQQAVAQAIGQEVQPLKQFHQQTLADRQRVQVAEQQAQLSQQNEAKADAILDEVRGILDITTDTDPLFNDVLTLWAQYPTASVHQIALAVRKDKVTPRLQGQAVQAATTEMRRKAAGSTANGTGSTAMPKRPTNAKELAAWMRARDASAPA